MTTRSALNRYSILLAIALVVCALVPKGQAQDTARIVTLKLFTEKAPQYKIIFQVLTAEGDAYKQLKIEDIEILVDNTKVTFGETPELVIFEKTDHTVGVVFVFPNAAAYREEQYRIKGNVANFLNTMARKRQYDLAGVVYYDANPEKLDIVSGQDMRSLANKVTSLKRTDDVAPNLYATLPIALGMLQNIPEAEFKYLIIISDAEGKFTADDRVDDKINESVAQMNANNIIPIVIAYDPTIAGGLYFDKLSALSVARGGSYMEVRDSGDLPAALNTAWDQIYNSYVFSFYVEDIEEGKHKFTVRTKVFGQDLEDNIQESVPDQGFPWHIFWMWVLYVVIGLVALVILIIIIKLLIKLVFKRKKKPVQEEVFEDSGMVPAAPSGDGYHIINTNFPCPQCGQILAPLSMQCPDCSNRRNFGKLKLVSGRLEGFTCFINEAEITIGSGERNSITLPEPTISSKHAAVAVEDGNKYEIRDMKSTNGTFIDGHRVTRRFLRDGDVITLGKVEVRFKLK